MYPRGSDRGQDPLVLLSTKLRLTYNGSRVRVQGPSGVTVVSGKKFPLLGLLILFLSVSPPLSAPSRGEGGFGKIISPGLEERLQEEDRIRVIALLRDGQSQEAPAMAAPRQKELALLRSRVLLGLSPDEARPGSLPLNFPVLPLEVTAKGLAQLQANGLVDLIQEDRRLETHTRQGLELIRAGQIRSLYGGEGVSVALIDTGVDYTHPALGGTEQGYGFFPNNKILGGYDFGEDDPDPMDNNGHGTTVSALAGGLDTQVGDYIGGVAPSAGLYMLKVSRSNGSIYSSDLIAAWDWVLTHQYDDPDRPIMVVSVSLGTANFFSNEYCDEANPTEALVTETLAQAGIAVFVSSGNYGICNGVSYPACLQHTISVGSVYDASLGVQPGEDLVYCIHPNSCVATPSATCPYGGSCQDLVTAADMVPCYSNSGEILDLLAPANCSYVPTMGGYLSCFYGTSGACAMAAGAAAVVQSYAQSNLGRFLRVEELKEALETGGVSIPDPKSSRSRPRVDIQGTADRLAD